MKQEAAIEAERRPKKVLFLITKATWGGAQRYVYDLATNLPREQFEPVVAFGEQGKLSEDLAKAGLRTIEIPALGRDVALVSDIRSFFQIGRILKSESPHVVHLNSSKAAALGALAARLSGVPRIIFTVHGWPFKEDRNFLSKSLIYFISWMTALWSDKVIVVSKEDERIGRRMLGLKKKVLYVPLGIRSPEFLLREAASAILPPPTHSWPLIVTIAELNENKGIRFAIEAIALLKGRGIDVSYFVIGDGEDRSELIALVEKLQVADRIYFLGFVPEAAKYLKAFDVFLLPSIKEGMPYVLIEAAMVGLPIVSTTVVDPMFLALSDDIPKVQPGDSSGLANALLQALRPDAEKPIEFGSPLSDMVERTIHLYTTAPTISVSSRA